ncbi:MAG: RNA polymerase subunit sigma-24, partial [Firmicutes bacterium]|nr:RNA polymerase subunit sigma-24 [Bacillota bacterium]
MLQLYLSLLDTQAEKDKFITLYESYRDLMIYVAGRYLGSDADKEIAVDAALHALLGVVDSIDDP